MHNHAVMDDIQVAGRKFAHHDTVVNEMLAHENTTT